MTFLIEESQRIEKLKRFKCNSYIYELTITSKSKKFELNGSDYIQNFPPIVGLTFNKSNLPIESICLDL